MRPKVKFIWRGPHHCYIGIVLIVFGWLCQPHSLYDPITPWLYGIGALVLLDDIIEHTITGNTPLRIIFEKSIIPLLKNMHHN